MSGIHPKFLKTFHPSRIILAAILGIVVVGYFFIKDYKPGIFNALNFSYWSILFLFFASLCMATRDIGYMIRIKILSDGKLTWLQAFRIIMLWEFTSAITPSAIGGTSVAVLYVSKENISVGRSTAMVLATSILDEMYFVIMFPLLLILVGYQKLFNSVDSIVENSSLLSNELFWFAIIGYSIKLTYVLLVIYGLFFKPRGLKWLILKIFALPFLRRWRVAAGKAGDDIIVCSSEFKHKPVSFWLKTILATFLSWTARYWVVNMIFMAFFIVPDHFLLFARQLSMWIMMLVSPTPGGSGFAEFIFGRYLQEFIPIAAQNFSIVISLAFLWRLFSYYPYLLIGSIILPGWLRSKFVHKSES